MSSKWPPELKYVFRTPPRLFPARSTDSLRAHRLLALRRQFVNETFAKCTDANRQAVETELKQVIYQAFEKGQLHSTDWKNFKLKRCRLVSPPCSSSSQPIWRAPLTFSSLQRNSLSPPNKRKCVEVLPRFAPRPRPPDPIPLSLSQAGLSSPRRPPRTASPQVSRMRRTDERNAQSGSSSRCRAGRPGRRRGPWDRGGWCRVGCTRMAVAAHMELWR